MNLATVIGQIPHTMEVNTRIGFLRTEINRHNHHYYVLGVSSISDAEYDKLYNELVALEKRHPELIDPGSPTQRVGVPSDGFKKVKHPDRRMLSLENVYTPQEVIDKLGHEDVTMEPKIDGASLKLIYKAGKLEMALTRHDGIEGDDVTNNARAIVSIPLVLPKPLTFNVVGEVYMTYTVFNELNSELERKGHEPMANPRNAAAGALKLLSPLETRARQLRFVAYGISSETRKFSKHSQIIEFLEAMLFQSVYMLPVTQSTQNVPDTFQITDVAALTERIALADKCRACLDLPTDGLVFKVDDLERQRELGEGSKYPHYAFAYKFPAEQKPTTLLSVTVQVGRTGKVTPVAELAPVLLSGTTVRRASLCNMDEINRLGIAIGDTVMVEKSAEIIPKVMGVAEKKGQTRYEMPKKCPCCQTPLEKPEGLVDWYCPNTNCADQVHGRLLHGCGKSALDIDGCGEALVRLLMEHGVRQLSEVFTVNPSFLKPAARRRFEEGRALAPKQPLWRKLHALGIDGFGQSLCQEVAARWNSLSHAFDEQEAVKFESLVGTVVFNNIVDYCLCHRDEIGALDELIGMTVMEQASGPLKGIAFCITGDLRSGSRSEVSQRIEAAGGLVKSSVTRHVNYLVQGTETGRVKREKAEKLGVPVITEQKLYELMKQKMPLPKNVEEKEY